MLEFGNRINVITKTEEGTFKVTLMDNRNCKELFNYTFTVYSNFDKKGLIDDAIFMYKMKR